MLKKSTCLPAIPGKKYKCPFCGHKTLNERGGYDLCPVCFWEDDGQDGHDEDIVRGGPNYHLSLTQARKNYKEYGACEKKHTKNVRPPLDDE